MKQSAVFFSAALVISAITQIYSVSLSKIGIHTINVKPKTKSIPKGKVLDELLMEGLPKNFEEASFSKAHTDSKDAGRSVDIRPGELENFPPEVAGPSRPRPNDVHSNDNSPGAERKSNRFHFSSPVFKSKQKTETRKSSSRFVSGDDVSTSNNKVENSPKETASARTKVGSSSKAREEPSFSNSDTRERTEELSRSKTNDGHDNSLGNQKKSRRFHFITEKFGINMKNNPQSPPGSSNHDHGSASNLETRLSDAEGHVNSEIRRGPENFFSSGLRDLKLEIGESSGPSKPAQPFPSGEPKIHQNQEVEPEARRQGTNFFSSGLRDLKLEIGESSGPPSPVFPFPSGEPRIHGNRGVEPVAPSEIQTAHTNHMELAAVPEERIMTGTSRFNNFKNWLSRKVGSRISRGEVDQSSARETVVHPNDVGAFVAPSKVYILIENGLLIIDVPSGVKINKEAYNEWITAKAEDNWYCEEFLEETEVVPQPGNDRTTLEKEIELPKEDIYQPD